jgi:hypothetical protein
VVSKTDGAHPERETWPVIVTPGPIEPDSGLEDMIRALPVIQERYPELLYVIIGPLGKGPENDSGRLYVDFLRRLAALLEVEDALRLVIDGADEGGSASWLAAAQLSVSPSANGDRSSVKVFARALADDRPVVATSSLAGKTSSDRGPDKVVPPAYYLGLADAVTNLLGTPPKDAGPLSESDVSSVRGRTGIDEKCAGPTVDVRARPSKGSNGGNGSGNGPERQGEPWSDEEIRLLQDRAAGSFYLAGLAHKLGRSEGAVISKARKIGLSDQVSY